MRQDQRERQGFLAFALAASGLILGLVMRSDPPPTAGRMCLLVSLSAVATLVAERMTIRASRGVASGVIDPVGGRTWWHTCLVVFLATVSLAQVVALLVRSFGQADVNDVWQRIADEERQAE